MHDYILNITLAKGSGEYCICEQQSLLPLLTPANVHSAHILAPYAHARMPIADRISVLKKPVTFICA